MQQVETNAHAQPLRQLTVGEKVFVQNQHGPNKLGWDRSGTIVETLPHSAYQVSMDGSGRLAKQPRQHLRPFKPWDQAPPQETRPEVYQLRQRGPEEIRSPTSELDAPRGIDYEEAASTAPPLPTIEYARTGGPPPLMQEPPARRAEAAVEPPAPRAITAPDPEGTKAPERRRSQYRTEETPPPLRRLERSTRGKPPDWLSPSCL